MLVPDMTLPECMTLLEIWPTTIFSVKLMHLCILIKTIPTIPHSLHVSLKLASLYIEIGYARLSLYPRGQLDSHI